MCLAPPLRRRLAVPLLEGPAERGLRGVPDMLPDGPGRKGGVAQEVGGGVEAYVREVRGGRLADPGDESGGERRPGEAARLGQFLDRPVAARFAVDRAQRRTDLRIERAGEPVRFGARARGPGAQYL